LPKPFTPEDLYRKLFDDLKIKPLNHAQLRPAQITEPEAVLYNLSYLRNVSGNNEDFIREMVSTFVQTVPPVLTEMQKCLQEKEWTRLSRLIHQIKPSFILLGIDALRANILFIEENSKAETSLSRVTQTTKEFIARCNTILPQLSRDILMTQP
jgi:HPt (histidine-containing phosphotransfer) domain-containing protein